MNRVEYMAELQRRLAKLPHEEVKEALEYYEQYFADAGAEHEQEALAELGSPAQAAAQIIAYCTVNGPLADVSAKKGLSTLWLVILAVFASPIALPLALCAVVMAVALVIVLAALLLSLLAVGICLLASGLAALIVTVPLIWQGLATAIFYCGLGLACLGSGAAIIIATLYLSKKCFGWLARLLGKFLLRRSAK